MTNLRVILLCISSVLLTAGASRALDPNKRLTQYAHTSWRVQDGFLPNSPRWITQTKDGFLLLGTFATTLRFDGVRFVPWTSPTAGNDSSLVILNLLGVRAGGFWISNVHGLTHVKDDHV